jgi:D-alanyl-D-alanine carboxypeptidase
MSDRQLPVGRLRAGNGDRRGPARLLQALKSGRWRIACISAPLRGRSYPQLRAILGELNREQENALAQAIADGIGLAPARVADDNDRWLQPACADAIARGLPAHHEAVLLQAATRDRFGRCHWLQPLACRSWMQMQAAAHHDGIELELISGFRSVSHQRRIIERKLRQGQEWSQILRVSAAPGYSEHHTGCAVDLATPGQTPLIEDFERSAAHAWLTSHAGAYGFSLSYPRGNRWGFAYEPWHWCFRPHAVS